MKAVAEGTIRWKRDPDFGYQIAASVPGFAEEDRDLLEPRLRYESQGRMEEYRKLVERYKKDREAHLRGYPSLDEAIVRAVRG